MFAIPLLKKQNIVAMTTTGRAKYSDLLQTINFPIVIVEEAAEVFEAHIMTSLSLKTSHVILIGDHEQLRPSPAVHALDTQYNLSMSMFERLIKNKVEHSTLATQRRMRPEIAQIMNFIYPDLKNHESVSTFPEVKGISKNLFFFDHEWKEESNDFMLSKANTKEAEMVVRFTWYILQQKQYTGKQITILTLYSGQLLKIKNLIKKSKVYLEKMREIRVVNVDNYQGEENDIILLSLVRSNDSGQIGFLKTSNRVCVALSRAKHGLYIFGNSKCLIGSKKLELWVKVIQHLKDN
jgi:superfamily I DNA and/or RNA helicase